MKFRNALVGVLLLWAASAFAQQPPATPSQQMPPLPVPAAAPVLPAFPELPPSRICQKQDMAGLWKLQNVYEMPAGAESASFAASPVQYIYFKDDNIYGRYNAGAAEMAPEAVVAQIAAHAAGLQQYLVQDSGFVYFYQNAVAIDTQVCFIVVNPRTSFAEGQMLLMPPQGRIRGRLVKAYVKLWSPPRQQRPALPYRPQPAGSR